MMLLKNLDLKADLINGSRLIIKNIFRHLLNIEILSVYHRGQRHYLPKLLFQPFDSWLPCCVETTSISYTISLLHDNQQMSGSNL